MAFIFPGDTLSLVESSMMQILNTVPGERVHLPTFGSRLKLLLFTPLDEYLALQIKQEIKDAINKWEDRVTISSVDVVMPDENGSNDDLHEVTAIVKYQLNESVPREREFRIEFYDFG